jgi:hypothetical protein
VEHRERGVVLAGGELEDLGVGAGLLRTELVAREGEYREAGCLVVFMKRTQTCVLWREASSAGDVDDQEHLIAKVAEGDIVTGDGLHGEVVHG